MGQSDDPESVLTASRSAAITLCLSRARGGELKLPNLQFSLNLEKVLLALSSSKPARGPFVRGWLSSVNCFLSTDGILVSIREVLSLSLSEEYRLLNYDFAVTTDIFFSPFVTVLP